MFNRARPPKAPKWCSVITGEGQVMLLIDPKGENLDYEHCPEFQQCVNWAIRGGGNVILNLAQTPYLDSSGMGLILELRKYVETRFRLILVAPEDETVHNILGITGLESLFSRVDTYEEALEALAHPEPAA
jgi:anti-anti-sigma factor